METEEISETSVLNSTLTRLIAREDFSMLSIEVCFEDEVARSSETIYLPNFMASHPRGQ
jgi:hypothetical protein